MYDEIFGELTLDYDYVAKKEITFFGNTQEVEIRISVEEDEEIKQIQRDTYEALMQNWEEMQHKIASAILQYYNEQEKGAYGPDDEDLDDNGVAVLIEDGEVSEVGYKDIAF